ncbi:MAG: hypothetical protein J6K28_08205 [Alistipes sp.]|nr:hypothetical protein [Alistipes sp.]
MKKFLLLSLLVFTTSTVFAQEEKTSTVKLKSGISVEGQIVERTSDGSVKVKTKDGDVFVYRANEIGRIETDGEEMRTNPKAEKRAERGLGNFKGYKGIVEIGGVYDLSWEGGGVQFTFINGYNFGAHLFAGIGVGVDYMAYSGGENIINVPVFLNLRAPFLKNTKVSPFFGFSIGYNITVSSNFTTLSYDIGGFHYSEGGSSNGVYIEPMIGIDCRIKRKTAFTVGLSGIFIPNADVDMAGLALKLGFAF